MADEFESMLSGNADALSELVPVIREKVLTGFESLTTNRPSLDEVSFSVTDEDGLAAEFAEIDHVGLDLVFALPSGGQFSGAVFMPLADLGVMLSIETGAERMADADFARAQLEMITAASREFFDLMTMTLFIDALQGIEVVPAGSRLGDPQVTAHAVMAAGDPVVRVDVGLGLVGGHSAHLVLLVPQTFVEALGIVASTLAPAADEREPLPFGRSADTEAFEDDGPLGFDIEDLDAPETSNVSPLRGGSTFGAPAREDVDAHSVRFPPLSEVNHGLVERRALDLIMDVSMRVTVELGRSTLTVEEVLSLGPGSVVELNKLAGEPVDVLVNEQLIARGEVVVVDENFGVRVTEIVSPRRRAQAMGA